MRRIVWIIVIGAMENNLRQILAKWEAQNKEIEPYVNALGLSMPKIKMEYSTRSRCILDLKQYLEDNLKNGANDTIHTQKTTRSILTHRWARIKSDYSRHSVE